MMYRNKKIASEYIHGATYIGLANKYKISVANILNILRTQKVDFRVYRPRKLTIDQVQYILKEYKNKAIDILAKEFGIQTSAISYLLRRHGLKAGILHDRIGRKCIRCNVVLDMINTHKSAINDHRDICKTCENAEKYVKFKVARERVLEEYGGQCRCCKINIKQFLTVDHINNDGKTHRQKVLKMGNIYIWLVKNGFPKDNFQLLCYNCNMAKGHYGSCPHKTIS